MKIINSIFIYNFIQTKLNLFKYNEMFKSLIIDKLKGQWS